MHKIPTNITGPELNDVTCKTYNRQGTQRKQCIDGYGPAAFSDGVTCVDCSKYKHPVGSKSVTSVDDGDYHVPSCHSLQVKGNSSLFNIVITYEGGK